MGYGEEDWIWGLIDEDKDEDEAEESLQTAGYSRIGS